MAIAALIWLPSTNSSFRTAPVSPGRSLPMETPTTMQRKTQRVRYCSKKPSRLRAELPTSAPRGLARADEGAAELPVDLGLDRAHVDAGARQELPRLLDAVDPRRLDGDLREAGRGELRHILLFGERSGDAADPELDTLLDRRRDFALRHDVGDGEPPARLQDAERLAQHAVLVGGQVDDAIRNDEDRKSTRLNSSHITISYAVFC